ncbi:DUF2306 domain-containing protein [Fulvivirga lutea]|uniref:DUF2306 domain-containing protein n=1 Tax=Fulvivirga lutea TaxID=2810512 RepID=A0A974WEX9_9BACT|nr:DUF2306 domain-containing protein [Fulvivirga lutea]QSE96675.1 hypothetical protein JR347_13875 [Fulvivirga lutea]
MEALRILAITHVAAGIISLVTGLIAMTTQKGGKLHRKSGKVYFYAMTYVFISAVFLSSIKFIPFLFMISFLSYYGCFAGVRILKLKKLHKGQQPKVYDWGAGILTILAGISFVSYGGYYIIFANPSYIAGLSIFFGVFTIQSGFSGIWKFIKRPKDAMYWWNFHISAMMGSYIAATTAFLVTIGRITDFNHWILWVAPALIGVPFSVYWQKTYTKKFAKA